jgi:hypothetical protein
MNGCEQVQQCPPMTHTPWADTVTLCQFADFLTPKYHLRPMSFERCHARPTQCICSSSVSCRNERL